MDTTQLIIHEPFTTTGDKASNQAFEEQYIHIRQKEQRLYDNKTLLQLPVVSPDDPHYSEWKIRSASALKLKKYLSRHQQSFNIAEIGCGNGWLSNLLASVNGIHVTGIDINETELKQAAAAFKNTPNLKFEYGDIRTGVLCNKKFDHIIFAASIQYFPSLKEIIRYSIEQLTGTGEIHILDSPLYTTAQRDDARARTIIYFDTQEASVMSNYYYHHTWNDLVGLHYKLLYKPSLFQHYILQNKNPFPWISIPKQ